MTRSLNLVLVLTAISTVSGLMLGQLDALTHEQIENNVLKFKKVPAVADIQEDVSGKVAPDERESLEAALLTEKRYLEIPGSDPMLYFVVKRGETDHAVVFESFGQGFGGDLGVMVGFVLATGDLAGIGITTLSETPGLGTHVRDAIFRKQFAGMKSDTVFQVKKDGGQIDAVTGATISSRAVATAVREARATYQQRQDELRAAIAEGTP